MILWVNKLTLKCVWMCIPFIAWSTGGWGSSAKAEDGGLSLRLLHLLNTLFSAALFFVLFLFCLLFAFPPAFFCFPAPFLVSIYLSHSIAAHFHVCICNSNVCCCKVLFSSISAFFPNIFCFYWQSFFLPRFRFPPFFFLPLFLLGLFPTVSFIPIVYDEQMMQRVENKYCAFL